MLLIIQNFILVALLAMLVGISVNLFCEMFIKD